MKKKFIKTLDIVSAGLAKIFADPKTITMAVFMILGVVNIFAAGDPFSQATTEILSYKEPVKNLMRAIAAVVALVGAFNVFHKMTNGDQDVKKTIMLTLGGCIAFVALGEALPAFFE